MTGQDRMVVSYMHMQILFKKTTDTQRKRESAQENKTMRNKMTKMLNSIKLLNCGQCESNRLHKKTKCFFFFFFFLRNSIITMTVAPVTQKWLWYEMKWMKQEILLKANIKVDIAYYYDYCCYGLTCCFHLSLLMRGTSSMFQVVWIDS